MFYVRCLSLLIKRILSQITIKMDLAFNVASYFFLLILLITACSTHASNMFIDIVNQSTSPMKNMYSFFICDNKEQIQICLA